jgi:hypothetical protein
VWIPNTEKTPDMDWLYYKYMVLVRTMCYLQVVHGFLVHGLIKLLVEEVAARVQRTMYKVCSIIVHGSTQFRESILANPD